MCECAICLDDGADLALRCGHRFHEACVQKWVYKRLTCPMCRAPIAWREPRLVALVPLTPVEADEVRYAVHDEMDRYVDCVVVHESIHDSDEAFDAFEFFTGCSMTIEGEDFMIVGVNDDHKMRVPDVCLSARFGFPHVLRDDGARIYVPGRGEVAVPETVDDLSAEANTWSNDDATTYAVVDDPDSEWGVVRGNEATTVNVARFPDEVDAFLAVMDVVATLEGRTIPGFPPVLSFDDAHYESAPTPTAAPGSTGPGSLI